MSDPVWLRGLLHHAEAVLTAGANRELQRWVVSSARMQPCLLDHSIQHERGAVRPNVAGI